MNDTKYCKICDNKHITYLSDLIDGNKIVCDICGLDIATKDIKYVDSPEIIDLLGEDSNEKREESINSSVLSGNLADSHEEVFYLIDIESGVKLPIKDHYLEIGRDNDFGFELKDRHISRKQILLEYKKRSKRLFISDISTYNTTLLNGVKMKPGKDNKTELKDKDVIMLYNKKIVVSMG